MTAPAESQRAGHDLIVVGTSMGGLEALSTLVAGLPADLPAAVLIVQHIAASHESLLDALLDKAGPLPASFAQDGEPVAHGRIYIAPPDRHLQVSDGHLRVARGPLENRARPAIDPLFRSAAVSYRSRTVGVILTGLLDDGAAGLLAVQRCGGKTVVQSDAAYPEMPRSALSQVEVDHQLPVAEIPRLLDELARRPAAAPPPVPEDIEWEVRLGVRTLDIRYVEQRLGAPVSFTCPDCGGALWRLGVEGAPRFRCHEGHGFTGRTLLDDSFKAVETALAVAWRSLNERVRMLEMMAEAERGRGHARAWETLTERARETRQHADAIKALLW